MISPLHQAVGGCSWNTVSCFGHDTKKDVAPRRESLEEGNQEQLQL